MERKDWNYKTYLGDCIDGMRLLPAGSVDFLFTDLPYGRTNCKWDTPIDLEAFWNRYVELWCEAAKSDMPFTVMAHARGEEVQPEARIRS